MTALTFMILVFGGSIAAGLLGALTGLGGGVIIIPLLVLLMGVDLRYAIGASLLAVVATSCGSAAAFVREGFTNVRVAVVLEVLAVAGAVAGAIIAQYTPNAAIAALFGAVLLYTAATTWKPPKPVAVGAPPDPLAMRLNLGGAYPGSQGPVPYMPGRVPHAMGVMFGAGVLSAMVGIGSGIVKVFAMDRLMRLPFKVSTTTSNFMIGVTAAASVAVYVHRGLVVPEVCVPVVLGALAGSFIGARVLPRVRTGVLRLVFAGVVAFAGVQMIIKGIGGGL
jgi:uncharacterized membrane protein YfcA